MHGANRDPGIDLTAEEQHADTTAVPTPGRVFQVFYFLHRRWFGRAGKRHRPHVRKQRIKAVAVVFQLADYMVYRVKEFRVLLYHPPPDHFHRPLLADPRLVVAVDVGTHRQLSLILLGIEQVANLFGVLNRRFAAANRPRDRTGLDKRAVGPHEHLGRSTDQVLATEVYQEFVGTRVDAANILIELARAARITGAEHLARHDLEKITAFGTCDHLAYLVSVFTRRVVATDLGRPPAHIGHRVRAAFHPGGRQPVQSKFITIALRLFFSVVDNNQLVR